MRFTGAKNAFAPASSSNAAIDAASSSLVREGGKPQTPIANLQT
jgi:hypothetical protein